MIVGCSGARTADKPRAPKSRYIAYYLPQWLNLKLAPAALYGPACPPERRAADLEPHGIIAQAKALAAYSVTLEQVATISVPSLVLHGTADKVVPCAAGVELDETLPDSKLIAYEGSGHNFVAEFPDRVAADVLSFTQDAEPRSAAR